MILVTQLIDLAGRIGGKRFAHELYLRRLERWRTFEAEYFLLDHLVPPDRAAVDVGANEGVYAARLGQLARQVHCFEPNPRMAQALRQKLRPNVTVHDIALSDHAGFGVLRIPYIGDVEQHGTATAEVGNALEEADRIEDVPCRMARLDEIVSEPVGFIKIDVEGHEFAVLQGATSIIARDRPVLLVESERRHHAQAPDNIIGMLTGMDYSMLVLCDGAPRAAPEFDATSHQDPESLGHGGKRYAVKPGRHYINNFLFVPNLG